MRFLFRHWRTLLLLCVRVLAVRVFGAAKTARASPHIRPETIDVTHVTHMARIDPMPGRSIKWRRIWIALLTTLLVPVLTDWLGLTDTLRLLSHLDHPWALFVAFPVGHLAFGVSVLFCRLSVHEAWGTALASLRAAYLPFAGETMIFYGLVAFSEELLFRGVLLPALGGSWLALFAQAIAFTLSHRLSSPVLMRIVDLMALGLGLGVIFLWLDDWWPLVIVHWVRNVSTAKLMVNRQHLRREQELARMNH